jgi:small subunit ribosomal protein S21
MLIVEPCGPFPEPWSARTEGGAPSPSAPALPTCPTTIRDVALLTRLAHALYSACLPLGPFPERDPDVLRAVGKFSREGVLVLMAEVKVQDGESIESALRRFKRKVQQEDIIKDIKKHSFYLKPGDKRRAKQALARKRSRKKQRRDLD